MYYNMNNLHYKWSKNTLVKRFLGKIIKNVIDPKSLIKWKIRCLYIKHFNLKYYKYTIIPKLQTSMSPLT